MRLIFFCFILLFSSARLALSQNDTVYFRHFSVEQGLSHRNVTSIIQDSLGFMYYGTKEGFNKFDGYGFVPFKHDPKNKNSVISDDITCLAVQKSGIIWIGTAMKGVNRYDPYSGIFTLFQNETSNSSSLSDDRITAIRPDTFNHVIWIGTENGLNAYDLKTEKILIAKVYRITKKL